MYSDYSAKVLNVSKNDIEVSKNKIDITYYFDKATTIPTEYLASIGLISFTDTALTDLNQHDIATIVINIVQNNQKDTYTYPSKDLMDYKKALEISSYFVNNFTAQKSEVNKSIVDTALITSQNLTSLNQISAEISSSAPIKAYTFDGFRIHKDDPNVLQIRVQIHSEKESVLATIQYNIKKSLIFYFGINDEL